MDAIGTSGTSMFRDHYGLQLGATEYNADLQPPHSYAVFDRMRRSDGTVGGALQAIQLPLIGATWSVEPGGPSARDQEVADFVGESLMGGDVSWVDTLRNILLFLPYGAMPFETVWEARKWKGRQKVWLKSLAPRMPATITRWLIDEDDGLSLTGVVQEQYTSAGTRLTGTGGTPHELPIPIENLVVFVNGREGADWRGVSILRSAYRHWDFKTRLELVQAMSIERRGMGITVGTLKGKAEKGGPEERDAKKALRSVHAHQKEYVLEYDDENGNGFAVRVEGVTGSTLPADTAIETHRAEILRAMCADTIGVGAGDTGSFALKKDSSSLFLQGLTGWGGVITETVNRQLIPRMVAANFDGDPAMPRLVHSRLDVRDVVGVANALNALAGGVPVITVDDEVEDEARRMLELPSKGERRTFEGSRKPAKLARRQSGEVLPDVAASIDAAEARGVDVTLARRAAPLLSRPLRGAEWFMDLAKIDEELDEGAEEIVEAASSYQQELAQLVMDEVTKAAEDGDLSDLDPLMWELPDDRQAVAAITAVLVRIANRGRDEVVAEVKRQGAKLASEPAKLAIEGTPPPDDMLTARARAYLSIVVQRMLAVGAATALDAVADGQEATAGLMATLTTLSDRLLRVEAGRAVTKANAIGRREAQQAIAEETDGFSFAEYTALLDGDTCPNCEGVDEQNIRYEVGSAEYQRVYPPYRNCQGGARCRCQMVLISDDEVTRTG